MKLLVRVDASPKIGLGHLMRCHALAEAWRERGGEATFLVSPESLPAAEGLRHEGLAIHELAAAPGGADDASATGELAARLPARWIVVDGYHFDASYLETLSGTGCRLLLIDDDCRHRPAADLVLNPNLHASPALYPDHPEEDLLLGLRYLLLRRELADWQERRWSRPVPERARRLLVVLGGGDAGGEVWLVVARALAESGLDDLEATLVLGGATERAEEIRRALGAVALRARLLGRQERMVDLLAGAELAVSAAGGTAWELAFLGVPALLLPLADNQRPVAQALDEAGAAVDLGPPEGRDPHRLASGIVALAGDQARRAALAGAGRALIDGRGADRVVRAMGAHGLTLRPAEPEDAELLWRWRNHPEVRRTAFHPEPIPLDIHRRWFAGKLAEAGCTIFIGCDETGEPVGQVRLEERGDGGLEIHVAVAPERHGGGFGTVLIRRAIGQLAREAGVRRVDAFIKEDNLPSRRAFEAAGFSEIGERTIRGERARHYVWQGPG